jgi:peptidoglycan/xylan/chitin deacetylase (PgdA/CDA1 family)
MLEVLLEKRRKKLKKYKWLQRGRKLVFFLVFLLLFFCSPQFIDTEIMGSMEVGLSEENREKESETQVVEPEEPVSENYEVEQEVKSEKVPEVNQEVNQVTNQEVNQEVKIAYLTFDDGPTGYLTNILDILAEYEVQATFFMLEPQMRAHADVLCRMNEEGHGLGLHGVTHNREQFYASQESVLGEMNIAQATLTEITGVKTVLIRTPYGSRPYMKPAYREAVEVAGYKLWDWNVDSKDWFYRDERLVSHTFKQIDALEKKKVTPVILLHERQETVQFLPQILEYLQSKNYVLKVPDAETVSVQFN